MTFRNHVNFQIHDSRKEKKKQFVNHARISFHDFTQRNNSFHDFTQQKNAIHAFTKTYRGALLVRFIFCREETLNRKQNN